MLVLFLDSPEVKFLALSHLEVVQNHTALYDDPAIWLQSTFTSESSRCVLGSPLEPSRHGDILGTVCNTIIEQESVNKST